MLEWRTQVCKKGGTLLTSKAYNARALTEWIARCLSDAAKHDEFANADDRLLLMASCSILAFAEYVSRAVAVNRISRSTLALDWACRVLLRNHLAKFLGKSERAGRVLSLDESRDLFHSGHSFCSRYVDLADMSNRRA